MLQSRPGSITSYESVRFLCRDKVPDSGLNLCQQGRVTVVAVHIHCPEHPFPDELGAPGLGIVLVAERFHELVHVPGHDHSPVADVNPIADVAADSNFRAAVIRIQAQRRGGQHCRKAQEEYLSFLQHWKN